MSVSVFSGEPASPSRLSMPRSSTFSRSLPDQSGGPCGAAAPGATAFATGAKIRPASVAQAFPCVYTLP